MVGPALHESLHTMSLREDHSTALDDVRMSGLAAPLSPLLRCVPILYLACSEWSIPRSILPDAVESRSPLPLILVDRDDYTQDPCSQLVGWLEGNVISVYTEDSVRVGSGSDHLQ
jgi:hypothetical protein